MFALVLVALAGCRHTIEPPELAVTGLGGAPKVYTLTNLHALDDKVSAANFQYPGLIPVCSEVSLLTAMDKYLQFRVAATGQEFWYNYHSAAGEPFPDHLAHYFGRACPEAELAALTPDERDAVARGVVHEGMRKPAVLLAIGYPPTRDTRTLELPTWRYWTTSNHYFTVVFDDDGRVEAVRE